jgi:hypothetical protein
LRSLNRQSGSSDLKMRGVQSKHDTFKTSAIAARAASSSSCSAADGFASGEAG